MIDKDGKISIYRDLNKIRVHVLLETEPFSNMYHRILLNKEQFKKFSDFMFTQIAGKEEGHVCPNPDCKGGGYEVDDDEIELPDVPDIDEHNHEIQTDTPPAN